MSNNEIDFLGRKEAKLIAGVAILMMMFHHIFGFSEYRINGNDFIESITIQGISIERMIAAFGKLCVALFAFCSGYAIWKRQEDYLHIREISSRIIRFLYNYWIILALFLLYGAMLKDPLPQGFDFIYNLIGLRTGPQEPYINIVFAWYVATYVVLVLISPFLLKLFSGKLLWLDILLYIAILLGIDLVQGVWHSILGPIPVAVFGMIVSKWGLFNRLNSITHQYSIWIFLIAVICIALIRQALILLNWKIVGIEGLFAALFIFAIINIFRKLSWLFLEKIVILLGRYSMNLWYLHGIFFTGSRPLQELLYSPQYSLFIFVFAVVGLLPVAIGCSWIQKTIYQYIVCKLDKILKVR